MKGKLLSLPEKAWFYWHQPLLLEMANTCYGRELLCITEDFPKLNLVKPNMVQARLSESQQTSEFRTANKYGRVIRHRWKEFQEYEKYLSEREYTKVARWAERLGIPVVAGATESTFHPDPHPETSTWDGLVRRTGVDETWTNLVGGNGTNFLDEPDALVTPRILASTTTDQYSESSRPITLFDTSAIDDTDTIDAVIISADLDSSQTLLNDGSSLESTCHIVAAVTASNTGGTDTDFENMLGTSFGESSTQDSLAAGYEDITLDANGRANINKTGISKFGWRYGWDINDVLTGIVWGSTNANRLNMLFAEQTGTTSDPKLVVTHSAAAGITRLQRSGVAVRPMMRM